MRRRDCGGLRRDGWGRRSRSAAGAPPERCRSAAAARDLVRTLFLALALPSSPPLLCAALVRRLLTHALLSFDRRVSELWVVPEDTAFEDEESAREDSTLPQELLLTASPEGASSSASSSRWSRGSPSPEPAAAAAAAAATPPLATVEGGREEASSPEEAGEALYFPIEATAASDEASGEASGEAGGEEVPDGADGGSGGASGSGSQRQLRVVAALNPRARVAPVLSGSGPPV